MTSGDARGTLYFQTARALERPGTLLAQLPPAARKAVEDAYATIEITDSVAQIGGHQVALVRGYSGLLQQATQALEADVMDPRSRFHEMTAVLDKVAAGELLARRQDMASNQLLSHALEQLLVRSKRMRDTEAATMNMRLLGRRDGRSCADRRHRPRDDAQEHRHRGIEERGRGRADEPGDSTAKDGEASEPRHEPR